MRARAAGAAKGSRASTPVGKSVGGCDGACHPGGLNWDNYLVIVCFNEVCNSFEDQASVEEMYGYPMISDELQWLDLEIGYQDSNPTNGCHG